MGRKGGWGEEQNTEGKTLKEEKDWGGEREKGREEGKKG